MLIVILILLVLLIIHTIILRFELQYYKSRILKKIEPFTRNVTEIEKNISINRMSCNSIFEQTKRIIHNQKEWDSINTYYASMARAMHKIAESDNWKDIIEFLERKESEVKE